MPRCQRSRRAQAFLIGEVFVFQHFKLALLDRLPAWHKHQAARILLEDRLIAALGRFVNGIVVRQAAVRGD